MVRQFSTSIVQLFTPVLVHKLVELKNGETFNGHLVNCDNFMNITLREVYQTNSDGDRFWKLKECYIRGSTVRHYSIVYCESINAYCAFR